MIKLLGCILIVFAFRIIGQKIALLKRMRLNFLENMLLSISDFITAIEIFSVPIPEALKKSGVNDMKKDLYESKSFFTGEDIKDFSVFEKGLDSEALKGQLLNAEAYEKKLKMEEKEEREKYKKEAKLIKGGFFLLGFLLIFIIM